jgi:hypothetical protein
LKDWIPASAGMSGAMMLHCFMAAINPPAPKVEAI